MRLEISKKTDGALRAICSLAEHDGRRNAEGIAADIGSSRQMVPKLMEPLVKAGWVASSPGPTGGYELRANLSEISALKLIEAVEGAVEDQRCGLRGTPCPTIEQCAIHEAWLPARTALLDKLGSTTIADVQRSGTVRLRS